MSAPASWRCGCDPRELSGIVPGERCPHCGYPRDPWPTQTATVHMEDARRDLAVAVGMVDKALIAGFDGDIARRNFNAAAAALIANRATNTLVFAQLSLHVSEEGRPATAMAGARDQDH